MHAGTSLPNVSSRQAHERQLCRPMGKTWSERLPLPDETVAADVEKTKRLDDPGSGLPLKYQRWEWLIPAFFCAVVAAQLLCSSGRLSQTAERGQNVKGPAGRKLEARFDTSRCCTGSPTTRRNDRIFEDARHTRSSRAPSGNQRTLMRMPGTATFPSSTQ